MRPGEIYLAQFPFGDAPGMKLRSGLLLTGVIGSVPEILVAYISSVIPPQLLPSDILIDPAKPEFHSTRLKTLSALRLHKVATIHCSSLARYLGTNRPIHPEHGREQAARTPAALVAKDSAIALHHRVPERVTPFSETEAPPCSRTSWPPSLPGV